MIKAYKSRILTICIPTYNRAEFLKRNLTKLTEIIRQLNCMNQVEILISDNCSTDETFQLVDQWQKVNMDIEINYLKHSCNLGPMKNILNLFDIVKSPYMMLLGDDDFIAREYLEKVLRIIEEHQVKCIVPSYVNITEEGVSIGRGRDLELSSNLYEKGFKNCLKNAWRGHQLSGLVFFKEGLSKKFKEKKIDNYYLQIYAVADCCLNGKTYHLTEYPIQVTRPPQKKKNWGYGEDGLMEDVFANFIALDGITLYQRHCLEMKFLIVQYWRYAMYLKKGIGQFFRCIKKIICSKNTSWMTKIIFPVSLPFILGGKALQLLIKGGLLKTLRTKVDI